MARSEIETIRELLASKPRPVGWSERRQRLDEVGSVWPVADDVKVVPVDAGGVAGEWSSVPGSDASRVLLFFHGGGYCSGSIRSHRRMVSEAGRAAKVRTLAIAYRLAPEHPYPAALEDACSAWRFLRQAGIAAAHIAVGGDSAGGGLTAALIGRLKAAGEELPGCAWLVSPWVDLTMSGSTITSKDAVDPLIHKAYLEELAGAYVPAGTNRTDPSISPLFADLRGFPPCLIQIGSAETLLADATRFAAAAGVADVSMRLEIWPHMIHACHLWNAHSKPEGTPWAVPESLSGHIYNHSERTEIMPKYLVEGRYTSDGLKGLAHEGSSRRRADIARTIESAGGKMDSLYFAFGDADFYIILDVPDNVSAAALSVVANQSGFVTSKVIVLLTTEDMDQAIKKTATIEFLPPGH